MSIKPRNLIIICTHNLHSMVQLIIIIEFGMKSRIKFRIDDAITKWTNKQSIQRFSSCVYLAVLLCYFQINIFHSLRILSCITFTVDWNKDKIASVVVEYGTFLQKWGLAFDYLFIPQMLKHWSSSIYHKQCQT